MRALVELAKKDLRVLSRDKFAMFWILAFPLMYGLFFGSIFGGDSGSGGAKIGIAIVDEARTDASRAFIEKLDGHESLNARYTVERDGVKQSELLIVSIERANELVRLGRRAAYLRIPAGYDPSPFAMFGAGQQDGDEPIEVGIDPSRKAEAGFLQGILMESMFSGIAEQFTDKAAMQKQIDRSLEEVRAAEDLNMLQRGVIETLLGALKRFFADVDFDAGDSSAGDSSAGDSSGKLPMADAVHVIDVVRETGAAPRSAFEVTFPSSMMWGLMSVALGFAITMVRERTQGTMLRLRTAPISRLQLLAGKALACFVMCILVMVVLLLFGAIALGVRVSNVPLLALGMVCTAVCFTGLMMTVSVMGKTESAVAGASWGLMMPFAMIGGGMIPLIAMPRWLLTVSDISFFKWGIYALEGAIWRGFTLGDMLVPCAVLLGIGGGFFTLGVVLLRKMDG